jgi:hypothetical protein
MRRRMTPGPTRRQQICKVRLLNPAYCNRAEAPNTRLAIDGARCLSLDPARQSDRRQPALMTNFDIVGAGSMTSDAFLVTRGASSQL